MNTNATIPTIDVESTALAIEWTDGANVEHRVAFDVPEHDNRGQLAVDIFNCMRHVYLMGADSYAPIMAESVGLMERNERQRVRIEAMLGNEAALLEQIATLNAQLDQAREERDAVGESIDAIVEIPAERATYAHALDVCRSGYSEGGGEDNTQAWSDPVLQELYQVGRQARIASNEAGVRIEALVGENGRFRNQLGEWERRHNGLLDEFAHIAQSLVEKAEEKGWCHEYEEWATEVNDRTRTLKLLLRDVEYILTVECDMQLEDEHVPGEPNWADSIQTTVNGYLSVTFTSDVTCSESEVDNKLGAFRRAVLDMPCVVRVTDTEYDRQ